MRSEAVFEGALAVCTMTNGFFYDFGGVYSANTG